MAVLVGKQAPDFTAAAVLANGEIVENLISPINRPFVLMFNLFKSDRTHFALQVVGQTNLINQ